MATAQTPRKPGALSPGMVIGRYTIVREIGRGGMCRVYEAIHGELDKVVALKVLRQELREHPVVVERFLREGRNASRVRHRNAIEVFDIGEHEGVVYLTMERLQGENLGQYLKREGALEVTRAVDLLLPVLAAVAEAHEVGVVHRDLKPENLFLSVDRRGIVEPRVLDFGISKALDDSAEARELTRVGALLGTPLYLAPELIRSARSATPASDQFALGVILYQCLTGRPPFRGHTALETCDLILAGTFPRPSTLIPTVTEGLEAVITRAMAPTPDARFSSVTDLGAALLPFASKTAAAQWSSAFDLPPPSDPGAVFDAATPPDPRARLASTSPVPAPLPLPSIPPAPRPVPSIPAPAVPAPPVPAPSVPPPSLPDPTSSFDDALPPETPSPLTPDAPDTLDPSFLDAPEDPRAARWSTPVLALAVVAMLASVTLLLAVLGGARLRSTSPPSTVASAPVVSPSPPPPPQPRPVLVAPTPSPPGLPPATTPPTPATTEPAPVPPRAPVAPPRTATPRLTPPRNVPPLRPPLRPGRPDEPSMQRIPGGGLIIR